MSTDPWRWALAVLVGAVAAARSGAPASYRGLVFWLSYPNLAVMPPMRVFLEIHAVDGATDGAARSDTVSAPVRVAEDVAAPEIANGLRLHRWFRHVVLDWQLPTGDWPRTDVLAGTARDRSDETLVDWVPWGETSFIDWWVIEPGVPDLTLYDVRLASTCSGTPGP